VKQDQLMKETNWEDV